VRRSAFAVGDCLFLVSVSVVATTVMHLTHELGWSLWLTLVCGMALAMGIQTLMATLIAPVLGSIESMVPSMVVAMTSPMAVCLADVGGARLTGSESAAAGAAMGFAVFVSIEAYGFTCRARFRDDSHLSR